MEARGLLGPQCEGGSWAGRPGGVSARRLLAHLRGPASALRIGATVWTFPTRARPVLPAVSQHLGTPAQARRAWSWDGVAVWLPSSVISSWQVGGCTGAATSLNLTTTLLASDHGCFPEGEEKGIRCSQQSNGFPGRGSSRSHTSSRAKRRTYSWVTRRQSGRGAGTGVVQPRASGSWKRRSPRERPETSPPTPSMAVLRRFGLLTCRR